MDCSTKPNKQKVQKQEISKDYSCFLDKKKRVFLHVETVDPRVVLTAKDSKAVEKVVTALAKGELPKA